MEDVFFIKQFRETTKKRNAKQNAFGTNHLLFKCVGD